MSATYAPARSVAAPFSASEKVMRAVILAGGLFVLALLAWGHLGLGALLVPPAATVSPQVVSAGPASVTFRLVSRVLTPTGQNSVAFTLRDAQGAPITNATVRVQPVMTTMAMANPAYTATATGAGQYVIHPKFAMAGTWRLMVTVTQPGRAPVTVPFLVGVPWT